MAAAKHTLGPLDRDATIRGEVIELRCSSHTEAFAQLYVLRSQLANREELLEASRPLVAMTFAEARAADDGGKRLLYCQNDVLNPCWDGAWSKEHGPGKHWGGGDACPECKLRAAIAKATGSPA